MFMLSLYSFCNLGALLVSFNETVIFLSIFLYESTYKL